MRIASGIIYRFFRHHWQGALAYILAVMLVSIFWGKDIGIGLSISIPFLILSQKEIHREICGED
jgi:hypothetical protein